MSNHRLLICGAKKPFQHESFEQVSTQDLPFNVQDIKLLSCGSNHIVVVTHQNEIYSAGDNSFGQLGIGNTTAQDKFTNWKSIGNKGQEWENIEQLICGMNSTAIITTTSHSDDNKQQQLFVCGSNEHGMLALGDRYKSELYVPVFTRVNLPDTESRIKQFSMGGDHCMLLFENGQLFSCGLNDCGQLGIGELSQEREFYSFQAVKTERSGPASGLEQVSCGYRHTLLWNKNSNELFVCGDNHCGQLGVGEELANQLPTFTKCLDLTSLSPQVLSGRHSVPIKQIFAGWYHSEVLFSDGVLFTCGSNSHGEMGVANLPEKNHYHFRQVNMLSSNVVIDRLCMTSPTGSTMALLKDTHHHTKNNNTIVVSGLNHHYQLGLGDRAHRNDLTKVPQSTFMDLEQEELVHVAHGSRISVIVTASKSTSKT